LIAFIAAAYQELVFLNQKISPNTGGKCSKSPYFLGYF
jgi:hypothetical protein